MHTDLPSSLSVPDRRPLRRACLVALLLPALVVAQTWNGAGANNNFSNAANWTGGVAPANDGTAAVTLGGTTRTTPTLDVGYNVGSLTIASSSSFTLGGTATLTLGSALSSGGSASNQYIDVPIALGGDLAVTANSPFFYLRGPVSGTGNLTVTGTGRLIFGADSTFSGSVSASNSAIWFGYYGIASGGSIPGDVSLGGTASLNIYRANDLTYAGSISGASTSNYVSLNGAGAPGNIVTTFTGTNTYAGATLINAGATLKIGAVNTLATTNNVRVQGTGLLWVAENQTLNGVDNNFGGHVRIDAGKTLTISNAGSYFGGSTMDMTGDGALVKTGAGDYSFSGGTINLPAGITVSQGTFSITGTASVVGPITNHATVTFNPSASATYSGVLSGPGGVTKAGTGTLTLGGANTYSGILSISGGRLIANAAGALPANSRVALSSTGVLEVAANQTLSSVTGSSTNTVQINAGATLTVNTSGSTSLGSTLAGTGTLAKTGAGTLTLTTASSYSGAVHAQAGTLSVSQSLASAAFTASGSGLILGGASGAAGSLRIDDGGSFTAGSSRYASGTFNAASAEFAAGGSFILNLRSATGTAGSSSGWDRLNLSGALSLTATAGDPFTVRLESLGTTTTPGAAASFSGASNYSWQFVTAAGGITGFDAAAFTVDTSGWTNAFSGAFSVGRSGDSLFLNYSAIPEPSTYAVLLGCAALAGAGWRRRRMVRSAPPVPGAG
jgi:autotransporter-associated beta strand protein